MSEYIYNAPTTAGRMTVTPTVACPLLTGCDCDDLPSSEYMEGYDPRHNELSNS